MEVKATGPLGALMALGLVDVDLHGVKVRHVPNGKASPCTHGEGEMTIYYLDGKRSSRAKCRERLLGHIAEGEQVVIKGRYQL